MEHPLKLYNTLSRKKEDFVPLHAPHVGLYLCGPTVYGDAHLGHARSAFTFDLLYRYLKFLGYKVRYVRNITDVGHLVNDADEGEDKIAKQAKLDNLEPMEVVQHYTDRYHEDMRAMNMISPSIEPRASGHIPEQIALIEKIIEAGLAYESQGSVYFDVPKYHAEFKDYGILSGRIIEDLMHNTRDLEGQNEKRSPLDFALWKNVSLQHIMRWDSPWGAGFPGWHLECSAMSAKYLGNTFDIHGGGMDLLFPHHECEIAQSKAANHVEPAKFWVHCNMITLNGQKMGKSLGNAINLKQFFTGDHPKLEQAYSPMTIRFFLLQAHYRSTLDFSNEALQAARDGYRKLMNGLQLLNKLPQQAGSEGDVDPQVVTLCENLTEGMNDDLNTARTIAALFELLKKMNALFAGNKVPETVTKSTLELIRKSYRTMVEDVLGLRDEMPNLSEPLLDVILGMYSEAKANRNYEKVDQIRQQLKAQGIAVKDLKTGVDWAYEK